MSRSHSAALKSRRYRTRGDRNAAMVARAKDRPCSDCGLSYPPYVMDLDHVRGEKLFELGSTRGRQSKSIIAMEAEIAKCDVVCSNCHRERTHQRRLDGTDA